MRAGWLRRGVAIGGAVLAPLFAVRASAQPPAPRPPSLLDDPRALSAFLDAHFFGQLPAWHVPGALFVLVKDGRVFLSRGYGLADVERGVPMRPDSTRVYAGSISKLVTATAVMQQVERGRLALDADVNRYLDGFRVGGDDAAPITLERLLTHSAGFDRRNIEFIKHTAAEVEPLGHYLARRVPPLVARPGTAYNYSNYSYALAGHLVERASGVPFDRYVADSILTPLGMTRSGFDIPPGAPGVAKAYKWERGRYLEQEQGYFNVGPAVSFVATADDVARLMLAQLGGGELAGRRVLSESGAASLQRRHFVLDPRLPGHGFGLHERFEHGLRLLEHGAAINGHVGLLTLIPDHNVGFFAACNATGCARIEEVVDDLLAGAFPSAEPRGSAAPPRPAAQFAREMRERQIVGTYRSREYSRQTFEKLRWLFDEYVVTADSGILSLHFPRSFRKALVWAQVAPDAFRRRDAEGVLVVKRDSSEGRTLLLFGMRGMPYEPLERLRFYETTQFQLRAAKLILAALVSGLLLLPVVALRHRRSPRGARLALGVGFAACALGVAFCAGAARMLFGGSFVQNMYGATPELKALLVTAVASAACAVVSPALAAVAWRRRYWTLPERLAVTLVSLGPLAFTAFLWYWNLIGLHA